MDRPRIDPYVINGHYKDTLIFEVSIDGNATLQLAKEIMEKNKELNRLVNKLMNLVEIKKATGTTAGDGERR